MDPNLGLVAASGLVNFLLKTSAEFLVCLVLVRIAGSARTRFNLWLTLLLGSLAQWAWMWVGVWRAASPVRGEAAGIAAAAGKRIAVAASTAGTLAQIMRTLLGIYLGMVAWRMCSTVAARLRLARAMRFRSAPDPHLAIAFSEVAEETASRDCELWVLPGVSSPATLGWLRPRVIVPPVCQTQDQAELKAVFWHELKHVQRRDALWNTLVRGCRNLLWFHPAVHHAIAQLNAQRELACDAAVVEEHPQSRDVYASCLVRFARAADLAPAPAVPTIEMASGAGLLTMRVRSILSERPTAGRVTRLARAAANASLVGVMAATVPGLNVLFEAQQRAAALQFSTPAAALVVAAPSRRRPARLAIAALNPVPAQSQPAAEPLVAAVQHDEALAAEHRAALGILTESTGMEAPTASGDGRGSISGPAGPGVRSQAPTSWTSVAVDAAARMGAMRGGHDGDDHHLHYH